MKGLSLRQKSLLLSALLVFSGMANAALDTAAQAAITAVETAGTDMLASWWPVLGTIFGGLLVMKLFKKAGNRAT
jgi:hypothetical protein